MGHENREKFLFCTIFWVISCTHTASSQALNNVHTQKTPFLISTVTAYNNSIDHDNSKRMVLLKNYIAPLLTDWKYATINNFTGQILYKKPVALVRKQVADSLQKAQEELMLNGLSLKFFDAYRPWYVTKKMWDVVPDERYAADPAKGSGHNRGIAVDVTLVKIASLTELAMPTPFDDFSEKAHHDYMQLSKEVIANRKLLKTVMEKHGFVALDTEWWHYSLANASDRFELLNLSFEMLNNILGSEK